MMRKHIIHIMLMALLLALPSGVAAQSGMPVVFDTVRLDVSEVCAPVTRLILENATEYDGKIYCLFREEKLYGYDSDTNLFCVIDCQSHRPQWEYVRGHYASYGFFNVTDSGVTYYNRDDSLSATFDGSRWNYAPQVIRRSWYFPRTLLDNKRYEVAGLYLGEWGEYTWVKDKKSGRSYLYAYGYDDAFMMGGRLVLASRFSIRYVDDEMLRNAKEGFCSLEKYRRKGFDWFVGITNDNPTKKLKKYGEWREWRKVRDAKLYTDTIGTLFQIGQKNDDWLDVYHVHRINDSVINCVLPAGDEIHMVVQTSQEASLLVLGQDGLRQAAKLLDAPKRICNARYGAADGKVLNYMLNENEYGLIRLTPEDTRVTLLIHNQDSLPWLKDDGFEKTFGLMLDSLGLLTREAVASHEASVGGTSDKVEWEPWRISYYMPDVEGAVMNAYYKTLADGLRLMSEYMIDSAGRVCGVLWDWEERLAYDSYAKRDYDIFDDKRDSLCLAKSQQLEKLLTELLGVPAKEDDRLVWHRGGTLVRLYPGKVTVRLAMYQVTEK